MFFPYRARIKLHYVPWLTILICALCVWIFWAQHKNQVAIVRAADEFCARETRPNFLRALQWVSGRMDPAACAQVMLQLVHGSDDRADVAALARKRGNAKVATGALATHYEEGLLDADRSFRAGAPSNLTARLWYTPGSGSPVRMVTAALAHGSWSHVIGNLLFFFAFAATIEILLGPILYLAVFATLAIGTHLMLLRGGAYDDRWTICFRCHLKESYVSINPHKMLDGAGAIRTVDDKPVCLFCHAVMPDPRTDRSDTIHLRADVGFLCWRCHAGKMNGELFNHHFLRKVPRKTTKLMKAAEQKHDVILPMQPRNRLTCSTCHNPHQQGVILNAAAAKGAGARHQLRLRRHDICMACHPDA